MRVRFEWFDGQWHDIKVEVPLVAIPDQDLAPWHFKVGRVVQLTLPSGKQEDFFIAGVYWNESLASPLVLVSRARSPSICMFSMVVPGFSAREFLEGCRKWFYCQVKGIPRIGERYPYPDRRFVPDTQTDFDFPAPMLPQPSAASSSMSGAVCNPQPSAAAVVEPSPDEAIAIAIDEGSDALEAAT